MSGESFQKRVELLRDSWAERRQLRGLAGAHDFDSQLALLRTLHTWAEASGRDVHAVYGDSLAMSVGPEPDGSSGNPAFSVTVGASFTVTFALSERRRMSGPRWFIAATVGSGGPNGVVSAAGPERRNGQWTRGRLEDILLSLLGSYERSLSEGGKPGSMNAGLRPRGA